MNEERSKRDAAWDKVTSLYGTTNHASERVIDVRFQDVFDIAWNAAASRWVSIAEPRTVRIPHKQTLLVTYEKFGAFVTAVAWFNEHRNMWFWGDTGEVPFDENIIAFQPLPEPYQPKENK